MFRSNLDFDDQTLEEAIIEYLDPENPQYNKLEYRGVCLVGYTEESYPNDFSLVEDVIFGKIQTKIEDFTNKIKTRLKNRSPLDTFVLEIFLVPFSDVEKFREVFLELLK